MSNPTGLAFDNNGNLYVANYGNNTIEKFNSSGQGSVFATYLTNGLGIYFPIGMAFDSSGNLYVANEGDDKIIKIDPEGDTSLSHRG